MSESSKSSRRGYRRLLRQFSWQSTESEHVDLPKEQEPIPSVKTTTFGGASEKRVMKGEGSAPPMAAELMRQPSKSSSGPKSHPLFSLIEAPKKNKKAMGKPEMVRYMEYMKEAGTWDPNLDRPVIYFK
ncbi:hypothetical protein QJS04_geneDACA023168 [Acorus gramineus]|uniref:Uncharacterized protein n=2 Tax=Acorus TaxID=4464 RepID=A0AAV9BVB9_ACOGR|nr:hypothetical protein QJS04_geneDACA023168 [Acorus gramineus]